MAKLFVVVFLSFAATAWAYSAGAPEGVCDDMIPKHPVAPQSSKLPYKITVDKSEVKPGDEVKINIEGKTFKGLFLQVREGDKAVGSFNIPGNDKYFKGVNCHGTKNSAASHKNAVEKPSATLTWKAPEKSGKFTIYATVAEDGGVFWAAVPSGSIKVA